VTVQTPQVFRADALLAAYAAALADGFDGVDTAQVVEHYAARLPAPVAVAAVPGDERNLKVTTPADLDVAERLARLFSAGRWLDRPS
jgi:2-C-methyl-D-erythritol 4-phosphate cytidylyltransferase